MMPTEGKTLRDRYSVSIILHLKRVLKALSLDLCVPGIGEKKPTLGQEIHRSPDEVLLEGSTQKLLMSTEGKPPTYTCEKKPAY